MIGSPLFIYIERFLNWLKEPISTTRFALYLMPGFVTFMTGGTLMILGFFSVYGNTRTEDVVFGCMLFIVALVISIVGLKTNNPSK